MSNTFLNGDLSGKIPTLSNEVLSANQIRFIDTDYRMNMLANIPNATEKLLAKNYLTQLAYGNANLEALSHIADEQGNTSNEIANLASTTNQVRMAILKSSEENAIQLDRGFENVIEASWRSAELMTDSISDLTMQMNDNANEIICAIEESQRRMSKQLKTIGGELNVVNKSLLRIEDLLINPSETKVQELIRRISHLISESMISVGDWQYENINDALLVIAKAEKSALGITNGLVWFQKGYCLWQSCKGQLDQTLLIEAKNAFDKSARLFTASNFEYFVKALRHKAHMCYLMKDYASAESSLLNISAKSMNIDTLYELARYKAKLGKEKEVLDILWNCFFFRSHLTVSIFADIDFVNMRSSIIEHIEKLRKAVSDDVLKKSHDLTEDLKRYNPTKISDFVRRGTFDQHKVLNETVQKLKLAKDFVSVRSIYESYVSEEHRLNNEQSSAFDYACILALWGLEVNSASVMVSLVNEDPHTIITMHNTPILKNIISLISQTIENHAIPLRKVTVRNIDKMEKVVNAVIRNYIKVGAKRAIKKECLDLITYRSRLDSFDYNTVYLINELTLKFTPNAFYKQKCEWLGEWKEMKERTYPIENMDGNTKSYSDTDIAVAAFENILLMYQTFPELCTPYVERVASLFIALRAYCTKDTNPYCEFSLNQISSNGIGVHLEFSFKNHNKSILYKERVFIPNKEIPKLLGKKIVKFSYGDVIPMHYFVPSILEWLDHPKMKDIINKIKHSSVFR